MLMLSGLGDGYADCVTRGGSASMCAEVWGSPPASTQQSAWWETPLSAVATGVVRGIVGSGGGGTDTDAAQMQQLQQMQQMQQMRKAQPWYTTTTGMIGIGIGALGLFMLLRK